MVAGETAAFVAVGGGAVLVGGSVAGAATVGSSLAAGRAVFVAAGALVALIVDKAGLMTTADDPDIRLPMVARQRQTAPRPMPPAPIRASGLLRGLRVRCSMIPPIGELAKIA